MSDKLYCELLYFVELLLEDDQGRLAIRDFLSSDAIHSPQGPRASFLVQPPVEFDLSRVLLGVASPPQVSVEYSARVLGFFRRLFELAMEESGSSSGLHAVLRQSVASLADRDPEVVRKWVEHLVRGVLDNEGRPLPPSEDIQAATLNSNSSLLLSMAKYLASLNGMPLADEGASNAELDEKTSPSGNDGSAVSVLLLEQLMSFVPEALNPANNGMAFADILAILCHLALGGDCGHFYVSTDTSKTAIWLWKSKKKSSPFLSFSRLARSGCRLARATWFRRT